MFYFYPPWKRLGYRSGILVENGLKIPVLQNKTVLTSNVRFIELS